MHMTTAQVPFIPMTGVSPTAQNPHNALGAHPSAPSAQNRLTFSNIFRSPDTPSTERTVRHRRLRPR